MRLQEEGGERERERGKELFENETHILSKKVFRLSLSSLSRLFPFPFFLMQTALARSAVRPCGFTISPRRVCSSSSRSTVAVRASGLDTNIFVNVVESAVAIAIPVAVSIVTAEKSDDEFMRTKSAEGLIPIGAAVAADAVAHSIPGEVFFWGGRRLEMGVFGFFFRPLLASQLRLESPQFASL